MGRWQPGADERLHEAALELFLERGFEQTMVSDIADRAGVTARTFFRHFADKREVLFGGSSELEARSLAALEATPASAPPMEAVLVALDAAAELIGGNRDFSRRRQSVIMANAELRERELSKFASMSRALTEGLRRRGAGALEARLAAEAGVAVYRVAFEEWVSATDDLDLRDVVRTSLAQLRAMAAPADPAVG